MICYSKPSIILLDDDPLFLGTLNKYLLKNLSNSCNIYGFIEPDLFLKYIERYNNDYMNVSDIYFKFFSGHSPASKTLMELEYFHPLYILDNNLSQKTTGIDLCHTIESLAKIYHITLLSGEVDYELANNLHNKKIISAFLKKDSNNLVDTLSDLIRTEIEKRKTEFKFDGEVPISCDSGLLYDKTYTTLLTSTLNERKYNSYLIDIKNGDLHIHNEENRHFHLRYNGIENEFAE